MARIPITGGGNVVLQPAQQPGVRPVSGLGQAVGQAASLGLAAVDRRDDEEQAFARAKDANSFLDHEVQLRTLESDFSAKVQRGEVPYQEARDKYQEELSKLEAPQTTARDPVAALNLTAGINRSVQQSQSRVDGVALAARDRDMQGQWSLQLDQLGKLANIPGADIESINKMADATVDAARLAGIPADKAAAAIQSFKDQNYFNDAQQKVLLAKDDPKKLSQLEQDLTAEKGYYVSRLDAPKRNALLNQVLTAQQTIENRNAHLAERRDARAERTIYEIERQTASGVPATAQMWEKWGKAVQGTTFEQDFVDLRQDELQVQQLLRKPIDEQLRFVQERDAALKQGGGSVRDAANLNRLRNAVESNVRLLKENPLLFNEQRTGTQLEPLDIQALAGGDPARVVAEQINDRAITLAAVREQYGPGVANRPLLPQEASQLGGMLQSLNPKQQAQLFSTLNSAFDDPQAFQGAMQQIAPDAPVKALAGMLAGKQAEVVTKANLFEADESVTSLNVAQTLLEGENILNASKGEKQADGKPKIGLYLPETANLQLEFQAQVGDAFAGRDNAAQVAYQAVKSYYVGRAAQLGRIAANPQDVDSGLVQEAVKAVLGSVVDYNGAGSVIAPWGMTTDKFQDRAETEFKYEARRAGIPEDRIEQLANDVGLKNAGEFRFAVTVGNTYLLDRLGNPIVIDLKDAKLK